MTVLYKRVLANIHRGSNLDRRPHPQVCIGADTAAKSQCSGDCSFAYETMQLTVVIDITMWHTLLDQICYKSNALSSCRGEMEEELCLISTELHL